MSQSRICRAGSRLLPRPVRIRSRAENISHFPCQKKAGHLCPAVFHSIAACSKQSQYTLKPGPSAVPVSMRNGKPPSMHHRYIAVKKTFPYIPEMISGQVRGHKSAVISPCVHSISRSASHTFPDIWRRTVSRRSPHSWRAQPSCSTRGACHNRPAPHSGSNASSREHCSSRK